MEAGATVCDTEMDNQVAQIDAGEEELGLVSVVIPELNKRPPLASTR